MQRRTRLMGRTARNLELDPAVQLPTAELKDLGWFDGVRVHLLLLPDTPDVWGLADMLTEARLGRVALDTVVVGAANAHELVEWRAQAVALQAAVRLIVGYEAQPGPVAASWDRDLVPVSSEVARETRAILARMGLSECASERSALAVAGFWDADLDYGADVVVVLPRSGCSAPFDGLRVA